jgi:zinc and cadmium transporter
MSPLIGSILGALAISIISLIGILAISVKEHILNKFLFVLVSLSTGALLGGAFFHLLPEAIEEFGLPLKTFELTLVGFGLFFILERALRWHHCHEAECDIHSKHLGYLNLIGDAVHNLIDGIIIYSAFVVSPALGIPVLVSIALHEIPQEIGDYGVLIYSGFKRKTALIYNFLIALTAIVGVFIGYLLTNRLENINEFLLPFAAGGFIYIAASDLIPELHKEKNNFRAVVSFIIFIIALLVMLFLAHQ